MRANENPDIIAVYFETKDPNRFRVEICAADIASSVFPRSNNLQAITGLIVNCMPHRRHYATPSANGFLPNSAFQASTIIAIARVSNSQ